MLLPTWNLLILLTPTGSSSSEHLSSRWIVEEQLKSFQFSESWGPQIELVLHWFLIQCHDQNNSPCAQQGYWEDRGPKDRTKSPTTNVFILTMTMMMMIQDGDAIVRIWTISLSVDRHPFQQCHTDPEHLNPCHVLRICCCKWAELCNTTINEWLRMPVAARGESR
jgi:hypothetical protein